MNLKEKNKNYALLTGLILIVSVFAITLIREKVYRDKKSQQENFVPEVATDNATYILPKALHAKILEDNEELIMIDARNALDYQIDHIKGSINIPLEAMEKSIPSLDKEKTTILIGADYSQKEALSGFFDQMSDLGFKNISILSGGISDWKAFGFPTVSIGNPESFVDQSKVSYLNKAQLRIAIEKKYPFFIVDVRQDGLFKQGHIPTAVNIPYSDLEKRYREIPFNKEVLIYSETPQEDFAVAVKLYDLGFMAAYILDGGLAGWKEKNYPLEQ